MSAPSLFDDAPPGALVVETEHTRCYRCPAPLPPLSFAWPPSGTWLQMCVDCAAEYAHLDVHPMRGYEACEAHRCARVQCLSKHREGVTR